MLGRFGTSMFGATEFQTIKPFERARLVAVLGDISTHGGTIINSGQDGTLKVGGVVVAVNGAQLNCPNHGISVITAIITKTKQNGKLLITESATAVCGARINPINRKVYAG